MNNDLSNILNKVYPVGSIYISVNSANPSSLFGGTWESWGSGRVPVGVNTNDSNYNTVEKTGGASSNSYSFNHNHVVGQAITTTDVIAGAGIIAHTFNYTGLSSGGSTTLNTKSISTLQPYITCYMWKRTA